MNRRKLQRRTAHAERLHRRWIMARVAQQFMLDAFADFYKQDRPYTLLTADGIGDVEFPGGRVIGDVFRYDHPA